MKIEIQVFKFWFPNIGYMLPGCLDQFLILSITSVRTSTWKRNDTPMKTSQRLTWNSPDNLLTPSSHVSWCWHHHDIMTLSWHRPQTWQHSYTVLVLPWHFLCIIFPWQILTPSWHHHPEILKLSWHFDDTNSTLSW